MAGPPPPLTPSDLVHLAKDPTASLPSSIPHSTLVSFLSSPHPSVPATAYLSAILTLISQTPRSPSLSSLISSLLLSFLSLFRSRRLPRDKLTSHLFLLFSPHLRSLLESDVPSILDFITADLGGVSDPDDALPLDLLPHLLNHETINPTIDKFLAVDWSKALLIKIVSLLRELPDIPRVRVSELLEKVFDGMTRIDIQDLPSLVYQLLVLASKGVTRREILKGILGFFEEPVKGPAFIVRQVEGTVLMHVNFAVKQDPSLGNEVIAIVRSDFGVINHFAVAVVLSIARVRRFSESAIGVLKAVVVSSQRDYRVSRDCKYLPDKLKEEFLEIAKCVEKAFIRAINESNCGREHVIPSIVQFCFVLLESLDVKDTKECDSSIELMGTEKLGICLLKTLFEVHDMARNEIIEQCKFRILSLKPQQCIPIIKLLDYLVQSYPYPMLEYVPLIKELLDYFTFMHDKTSTRLMRAILPLVKFSHDLQDYIILVLRKAMFRREDTVRTAAINAIIDLIFVEIKYKKHDPDSLQDSSSQASCSQQADILSGMGRNLFQELSGLLRRSLSQQARVREITYQGLMKLVVLDPLIAGPVFDLLWPHFRNFYSQETGSLLRFDSCVKLENGKVLLAEPLEYLLWCVSWILLLQPHGRSDHPSQHAWPCFGFSISQENGTGKSSSGEQFSNSLLKIRKSLICSRLEDQMAQGQSQNPASHTSQGEKTYFRGWILLGVIEVFVNVVASELEKTPANNKDVLEREIIELVDSYCSVEKETELNKQGGGRKGGSKVTTQDLPPKIDGETRDCPHASHLKQSQTRRSFFATSSIHQLLVTAMDSYKSIRSSEVASQNNIQSSSCKKLDQCLKLISFALKVCLRHLKSISAMEGRANDDTLDALMYGDAKKLACPIMLLAWLLMLGPKVENDSKKKETKGKKNLDTKGDQSLLSLLCLNELFKINSSAVYMAEIVDDLNHLATSEWDLRDQTGAAEDVNYMQDLLEHDPYARSMHLFLEKKIKPLYARSISQSRFQECEVLSELISRVGKSLPNEQRKHYGNWAVGLCRSKAIRNPSAARSLASLAIYLLPAPDDLIVAHDIGSELLKVVGSEDKDPIEISVTFPIIGHSTKNVLATMLLQLFEISIADLDWALSRLKDFSVFRLEFAGVKGNIHLAERHPGLVLEETMYSRSEALVNLMSSFTEMNLKDSQAEQLLKLTARFYKLLARMTKLRIAPKGCRQLLPGQKFQKLAEVTCKKLTSPLYNFMALVQRNQQENAQNKGIINKIKWENRCIPDLIYHIEDYERYLIQLSKLTKVNLLRHAKRSTARDFKIIETKKITAPENEPSQEDSASSASESADEPADVAEENASEKALSAESDGEDAAAAEDTESEGDEQEMLVHRKRAKMTRIVQDSDEEG